MKLLSGYLKYWDKTILAVSIVVLIATTLWQYLALTKTLYAVERLAAAPRKVMDLSGFDDLRILFPEDQLLLMSEAGERAISTEALHFGGSVGIRSDLTYILNHGELEIYDRADQDQSANILTSPEQQERPLSKERLEELKSLGYL